MTNFVNGSIAMQVMLMTSQIRAPLPCKSIKIPARTGIVNALMAKHCENIAIAIPLCSIGEVWITASVAVGRNDARANANGN